MHIWDTFRLFSLRWVFNEMQGKVSKSSKQNLQNVYSWSDQSAMNIKTNQRCKSEVEACKPTAVATYFHWHVAFLFESLFRLVIAAVAQLSVLCMPPEGRGAACCNCCCIYLLRGIAEFCDFLPTERSRCGPVSHSGDIESSRDCSVRSYTDLSRNQPFTLVAREGCWMFGWHNFCTPRPLVQNM